MKTTDTSPLPPGADDALLDEIELQLRALTTAPLHAPATVPSRSVDEFADGFPGHAHQFGLAARQLARRLNGASRGYL
jgi:hypothetical protein